MMVVAILLMHVGCASSRLNPKANHQSSFHHLIENAVVYDGILALHGSMDGVRTNSDYGVRVNRVSDDLGNELLFKSMQFFTTKGKDFEFEFTTPSPVAKKITYDIVFLGHGHRQRLQGTLELERNPIRNYRMRHRSWE